MFQVPTSPSRPDQPRASPAGRQDQANSVQVLVIILSRFSLVRYDGVRHGSPHEKRYHDSRPAVVMAAKTRESPVTSGMLSFRI